MDHLRIWIRGIVQGVGFRPFVWKLAQTFRLGGWVRNDRSGVEIEVYGSDWAIESFLAELSNAPPPRAAIERMTIQRLDHPTNSCDFSNLDFRIVESTDQVRTIPWLPPDVATCSSCLAELLDPTNRRYRYPFIQCNDCGPRYSILETLPFDRGNTTMRRFPVCEECEAEYRDPDNRRFHSQTIACPTCGPDLWWESADGSSTSRGATDLAIQSAIDWVRAGKILAICGIGGFQLACDARNDRAVQELRLRKGRGDKPLAVMVRDLDMAGKLVHGGSHEWQGLSEWTGPIVALNRRTDARVADQIAPGLSTLGIMLPYSPIHHLLMQSSDAPWVMTSGNRTDEPIVTDPDLARRHFQGIADGYLMHNRPIANRCDDSVIRISESCRQMIRRSRGYLLHPIDLGVGEVNLLAVGADMKAACCIVKQGHAYVGPPLGDLADVATMEAYLEWQERMTELLDARPDTIVADLHPGYLSTQWAQQRAVELGIPSILVQHHHAHLGALAAETSWDDATPLLGWVLDGTGYSSDGTIWGGEAFVMERGHFVRMSTLEPFPLPGGDAAIRFPFRTALALLHHSEIEWNDSLECVGQINPSRRSLLKKQLEQNVHVVLTTSMGRLFDGVASLLGVRHTISYEAQAAIELEEVAIGDSGPTDLRSERQWLCNRMDPTMPFAFPTKACVRYLVDGIQRGVPTCQLAHWFHRLIAAWMLLVSLRIRDERSIQDVGFSGGVFQNRLLRSLTVAAFREEGFRLLVHESWPCHDGSLGLGQAWIASRNPGYGATDRARWRA